jgi:hypothetical protein
MTRAASAQMMQRRAVRAPFVFRLPANQTIASSRLAGTYCTLLEPRGALAGGAAS